MFILKKYENVTVLVFDDHDEEPRAIIPAKEIQEGKTYNDYRVVVIPWLRGKAVLVPISIAIWNLLIEYVYSKHSSTIYVLRELENIIKKSLLFYENNNKANKIPIARPEELAI